MGQQKARKSVDSGSPIIRQPDCRALEHRNSDPERADFIREIVAADVRGGRHATIVTRFPPEPNGYLHIGHAKSICLNFGIAREFGGRCHLRFDDTNPVKEEQEYIDAIEARRPLARLRLGRAPLPRLGLLRAALRLGRPPDPNGQRVRRRPVGRRDPRAPRHADRARSQLAVARPPGRREPRPLRADAGRRVPQRRARPARARSTWPRPTSTCAIRCSTGSSTPTHPRTGDAWCIYPTYDFAHGQSDAIEGVTHSICTLEFEAHRPLYDWLIEHLPVPSRPRQYEFARLNLTYTVLSKRFLLRLVEEGHVRGWDDPRMPTISGLRRRGFPAEGIRDFADDGRRVTKADSVIEIGQLEYAVRAVLNRTAPRRFGVLDPLKVVIENYPEGQTEEVEVPNNPEDPSAGTRPVPFSRELWIERDDFMEEPRAEVLPARAGSRGAATGGVLRHLPGGRQGRHGRVVGAALHLRPCDPRRRCARRPPAEGDAALGGGGAAPSRPRCASTTISSRVPTRARATICSPISTRTPRPC